VRRGGEFSCAEWYSNLNQNARDGDGRCGSAVYQGGCGRAAPGENCTHKQTHRGKLSRTSRIGSKFRKRGWFSSRFAGRQFAAEWIHLPPSEARRVRASNTMVFSSRLTGRARALGLGCVAWAVVLPPRPALADNPIVQTIYTADPAPMVHGDTVYLCTSHDEDVTVDNFFTMNDWRIFSSKDMVNWTDHGSPLSYKNFSWAKPNKSWAPHCVERNGKFYFYVPVSDAIGVAVADSPTGPFVDAIGEPLLSNYQYIDPTVFVDDDGQAYLYFGNPKLWYVKLNEDMISFSGNVEQIPNTTQSFGTRSGSADRPTLYEEGPWFYKRNDLYYMVFASGPLPETISYSTSTGPTGPWAFRSTFMDSASGHAFTNHSGVIDFKGHSYMFYHTQELPGGGGYKRSVALEEFTYGQDGTIPKVQKTKQGPEALQPLSPFQRTEGETIAWTNGVEVEDCSAGGRNVASIENGDYIKVKAVDFGTGALSFQASTASAGPGGQIELHLDATDGPTVGTCEVAPTGDWQSWSDVECDVEGVEGLHDLFLVFKGGSGSLFNLDFWQFVPIDPPLGTGGAGTGGEGALPTGGASASGGESSSGGVVVGAGGSSPIAAGGVLAASGGVLASGGQGPVAPAVGGSSTVPSGGQTGSEEAGCACGVANSRGVPGPIAAALALAGIALVRLRGRRRFRVE
jgi:arabinoxylan arabinofuranohydrolase